MRPSSFSALILSLVLASAVVAGEPTPPQPYTQAIPAAENPEAARMILDRAEKNGKAIAADLTFGHGGRIVEAVSAQPLAPGRYRLHALVASTPHDHILVEAVALRLIANGQKRAFERREAFSTPGKLSPVAFDFVVEKQERVKILAEWFVGDTALDMMRYRKKHIARNAYRKQRQHAINQHGIKHTTGTDMTLDAEPGLEMDLELDDAVPENKPRYEMRARADNALPDYRMLLAGLVVEKLSPVEIQALTTDKPAYEPGSTGNAVARLINRTTSPAEVTLTWRVVDDYEPATVVLESERTITLAGKQTLEQAIDRPFSTEKLELAGRVDLTARVGALRPARSDIPFVVLPPPRAEYTRDKRIFGHYMGCWPIGYGALPYQQKNEGKELQHESQDEATRRGGHVRNYALRPPEMTLTPEESADLEIRRALRIGIDGFAIDAWAGADGAKEVFDTLIRTADAKDYPFEVTVCIDPACGGNIVETVRWLVENYGDHPKLARRNGQPIVFGYYSKGLAFGFADRKLGARTEAEKKAVRTTPLGWHMAGLAYRDAERQLGRPIFYHFSYEWLFHPYKGMSRDALTDAVGAIARHVDAVGSFNSTGGAGLVVAKAVHESGAEWSGGIGMYQKENIPYEVYAPPGTDWLEGSWKGIREQGATLPQLITWNDYGENTNIAPAWETRYTLYDLTGYHIQWWKTGKQPEVERDRVYLTYAKYPRDAKVWPFAQGWAKPRKLEVLTILPEPATIRLPGRDIEFEAPAGYSRKQFPLSVGPVVAEVVREGKVVTRIESPEPITDRPFRESNGMICFSTEFMRHWKADFGEAEPFLYGEYADDDNDGMPNWFEMYWFTHERGFDPKPAADAVSLDQPELHPVTRWLNFSTMTLVQPDADPNGDGKTNLESYRERIDPVAGGGPKAKMELPEGGLDVE